MTESQIKNEPLQTEQKHQPINVEIQRIYVKEQSCKAPHGNQVFRANGQPETSTEININSRQLVWIKEIEEIEKNAIDKIMQTADAELGLEFLLGKLNFPG